MFQCLECGARYIKPRETCRECGGADIDLAEEYDAPALVSRAEFNWACTSRTIDPGLALENPNVRKALRSGGLYALESALDTEF